MLSRSPCLLLQAALAALIGLGLSPSTSAYAAKALGQPMEMSVGGVLLDEYRYDP